VWPAGHATGHYGLVGVEHGNDSASISTPSGFSLIATISSGATNSTLTVFGRFATSGAMPNVPIDFNVGGTQNHKWGQIYTFSGVNTATPIHSVTSGVWGPASTDVAFPGLQTLLPDCYVVGATTWANDDAGPLGSAPVNAGLGSLVELYDGGTITGNGGGLYFWGGTLAAFGRIDPTTVTFSSAILGSQIVIALTPADKQLPTLGRKSRVVNSGAM